MLELQNQRGLSRVPRKEAATQPFLSLVFQLPVIIVCCVETAAIFLLPKPSFPMKTTIFVNPVVKAANQEKISLAIERLYQICKFYLDYSATTPPRPEVVAKIQEVLVEQWGNPV